jgi:two-component system sensor histidine kinase/response regulator
MSDTPPHLLPTTLANKLKSRTKPVILVVDDQPINIKLLERKLQREDMTVFTATNGRECLEIVKEEHPDLILLDVMMPEMDGIETCQRLKANPRTQSIPVIFITAKSSKEGKLEGLGVGAADYITKPIDLEETLARIKTQLRIQSMYRENLELQKRLGEARRSATVGAITQGIAHNLNNLLGVVVGYLDLLKNAPDNLAMVKRSVGHMDSAIQRMITIIRQLSTLATEENIPFHPISIADLIKNTIDRFHGEYDNQAVIDVVNGAPEDTFFNSNAEVLESIVGKLLINALESYTSDAADKQVEFKVSIDQSNDDPQIVIAINDRGSGIDPEIVDTLFEPFISTKTSVGRGLGLTMARHASRSIRGDLIVKNRPGGGTTAQVTLPLV